METKKEQTEKKNYTTPTLAAVLILLIIGAAVGYFIRGQSKPVRKRTIHRPAGTISQVEKKAVEPVKKINVTKEAQKTRESKAQSSTSSAQSQTADC